MTAFEKVIIALFILLAMALATFMYYSAAVAATPKPESGPTQHTMLGSEETRDVVDFHDHLLAASGHLAEVGRVICGR